jgi:hypothetical protein
LSPEKQEKLEKREQNFILVLLPTATLMAVCRRGCRDVHFAPLELQPISEDGWPDRAARGEGTLGCERERFAIK